MRTYTYDDAAARVDHSPRLSAHRASILHDWPEGEDHWRWVCTAKVSEIVDWAETVEAEAASAGYGFED
jgi:hypothetical protein